MTARAIVVGVVALVALGLRTYVVRSSAVDPTEAARAPMSAAATGHFDHTPRHGGLVLMNGDTHFEVVLDRDGACSVYFTDAVRAPLPASIASAVSVAMTPPGQAGQTIPQAISMTIDATNARWFGQGGVIDDPDTTVRIAYTAGNAPYSIDVPASAWPQAVASHAPKRSRPAP